MPFDHFNLVAGLYDRSAQFTLNEQLLQLLAISPENILLDAGGGTGRVASAFRGLVRKVIVADLSLGMLRHALSKGLASVYTPVEHLPFQSMSFDRVVMVDVLHHVFDHRLTAYELWRVLNPGGRILIIEPDFRKFIVKLLALGEKALLMRSHFLSCEKIAALFKNENAHVDIINFGHDVIVLVEKVR